MRWLLLSCCLSVGCVSLQAEQRSRISAYKADQSRDFVTHLAETKIDPRQADIVATVTADGLNAPLQQLRQSTFPAGQWDFVPTKAPHIDLCTGSALLSVTGVLRKKTGGREVEVTIVAGLTTRWNAEGSHIFLKPAALAVVPTLGVLDFALGSYIRSFAEEKAQVFLRERIGEIDVPIQLNLPIRRGAIQADTKVGSTSDAGAVLRLEVPPGSAEVKLQRLYLWLLEGRLVVIAFADIAVAPKAAP